MSQQAVQMASPPSKGPPMTILLLRLLTLLFLKLSIIVLVTDSVTLTLDLNIIKVGFKDVHAYRYLLSAAVIGCTYTLMQIPLAVLYLAGKGNLLRFDRLADQVVTLLLASGVGAGFGATVDLQKVADELVDALRIHGLYNISQPLSKLDKFFDVAHASTGFLLLGCLCMTLLSLLSSCALVNKTAVAE